MGKSTTSRPTHNSGAFHIHASLRGGNEFAKKEGRLIPANSKRFCAMRSPIPIPIRRATNQNSTRGDAINVNRYVPGKLAHERLYNERASRLSSDHQKDREKEKEASHRREKKAAAKESSQVESRTNSTC